MIREGAFFVIRTCNIRMTSLHITYVTFSLATDIAVVSLKIDDFIQTSYDYHDYVVLRSISRLAGSIPPVLMHS